MIGKRALVLGIFCVGITLLAIYKRDLWSFQKKFLGEITTKEPRIGKNGGVSQSEEFDPRPRGLRLGLMGDSISRYNYLIFSYFLKCGTWYVGPKAGKVRKGRNIVNEWTFSSWDDFFNFTFNLFRPNELCDCFRNETMGYESVFEGRYFYDPERDNLLVYVQALGYKYGIRGLRNASTVIGEIPDYTYRYHDPEGKYLWNYSSWSDVIRSHVRNLQMPLTHMVFNTMWDSDFEKNETARTDLLDALSEVSIKGIWRTTTYHRTHKVFNKESATVDKEMSKLFHATPNAMILNASWTQYMRKKEYWNPAHFFEDGYRVITEDLLEVLGHEFPSNYTRLNRTSLYRVDGEP